MSQAKDMNDAMNRHHVNQTGQSFEDVFTELKKVKSVLGSVIQTYEPGLNPVNHMDQVMLMRIAEHVDLSEEEVIKILKESVAVALMA